jgi:hypothetical protein
MGSTARRRMTPRLVIATGLPNAGGEVAAAAAVAVAAASLDRVRERGGVLLVELGGERRRGPTMLASQGARRLEEELRGEGLAAAARGALCWVHAERADDDPLAGLRAALRAARPEAAAAFTCLPSQAWRGALEDERLSVAGALLRAELPEQRPLAALAVRELIAAGVRAKVVARAPGAIASRRAIAGLDPGGATGARARRLAGVLLGPRPPRPIAPLASVEAAPTLAGVDSSPIESRVGDQAGSMAPARRRLGERGQALPLVLGAGVAIVICALLLVALGGAVTGKARAQRVADLAAVSAARSMRDDYRRLFAPAHLPDGRPNPRHLAQRLYLERAVAAGREAAERNGADPARIRVTFPDRRSFAPLRARVEVVASLEPAQSLGASGSPAGKVETSAEATLEPSPQDTEPESRDSATGDEYSGPLAHRQGKPIRPDVAEAFDGLAAAARRAGISLVITSAYRSNAEQARLFAQNPDPRWVAPPGKSLHRCATELDLGPPGAYGWLAANAPRFGFLRRYSWEPWHFGYTRGPTPCSAAGNRVSPSDTGADGRLAAGGGLPAFVPARFRVAIASAASRHDVSAALLAAQLLAESNFNPFAVSPAGAQGIAQFMPGTAAEYGLRDPFDPRTSIDAQARLMADLLGRFGSVALALAAYNAGPAPVSACSCVPAYPETQAYVARILGLLDGAGELAARPLEVRLVG